MKIERIRIQKFRSLEDCTVSFGQVLAIVGANNAGKSHILRALNAFFNFNDEQSGFEHQDHAYSMQSRPRITVIFSEISEEDGIPAEYIYGNKLTIKFTYRWDRKVPSYEVIKGADKITISNEIFQNTLHSFRFIYVPIIRNSDHTFNIQESIAYTFLRDILKQQIARRDTLQPLVNNLYNKIDNTIFRTAIRKIKQYYPFDNTIDFSLAISNSDPIDSIIHDVTLNIIESSQSNDIKNCGSGIQSAVYFAIALASSMDSNVSYMVGIEEPELNMHPQAQRKLIESLKDTEKYPNTQFVLTTHSTVIIDRLGHDAVVLCRKRKGDTRDIVTTTSQIGDDFWEKYDITRERYGHFFEYKNSDFFFTDAIIICESSIDCGVMSHLLKNKGINPAEAGITFIPADGEKNVKYPYAIVKELGIPFLCIVDRDVFQPYLHDQRSASLDANGIPLYKNELKTSSPICNLVSPDDKERLLHLFQSGNYENALDLLDRYSIISMRYALEVDLLACRSYYMAFCNTLNLSPEEWTTKRLATERGKEIKKLDNICAVLDQCNFRNLPVSYRRIYAKAREISRHT